nr:GNAT family N-acetyltransferase [Pseudomonas mendocina]
MKPSPAKPLHLPDGGLIDLSQADGRWLIQWDDRPLATLRDCAGDDMSGPWDLLQGGGEWVLHGLCYYLFCTDVSLHCVRVASVQTWGQGGLPAMDEAGVLRVERSQFWQQAWPWLPGGEPVAFPQFFVLGEHGRRHPRRPPKPAGELYRRYGHELGQWFSLRALNIEEDLQRFNRWQNTPRVLQFWQEGGTLEEHRNYLQRLAADPHSQALIGCFDDQPFAYFEVYWAKEDRIAPYYDAGDYDRGMHMLVGEEVHRGAQRVACWLPSLLHYLFLDDPRTQRIVSEPRADNARMIAYMQETRLHCEKEFDFPHKRAALMMISRERFFDRCMLA